MVLSETHGRLRDTWTSQARWETDVREPLGHVIKRVYNSPGRLKQAAEGPSEGYSMTSEQTWTSCPLVEARGAPHPGSDLEEHTVDL